MKAYPLGQSKKSTRNSIGNSSMLLLSCHSILPKSIVVISHFNYSLLNEMPVTLSHSAIMQQPAEAGPSRAAAVDPYYLYKLQQEDAASSGKFKKSSNNLNRQFALRPFRFEPLFRTKTIVRQVCTTILCSPPPLPSPPKKRGWVDLQCFADYYHYTCLHSSVGCMRNNAHSGAFGGWEYF
jgi:hypothetical protein